MATITIAQAQYLGNKYGKQALCAGGPERPNIKETAGQTYVKGDPIKKDSNGTIAVATEQASILDPFAGFALEAATGVTGTPVRYRVVQGGDRYLMNLDGASTDNLAQTQVGGKYMLQLTGNNVVVNPNASFDATKPYVIVEELYTIAAGFAGGDAVDDTNGRMVVWFPDQQGLQG